MKRWVWEVYTVISMLLTETNVSDKTLLPPDSLVHVKSKVVWVFCGSSLQICSCFGSCGGVLGHEFCDFADEVWLFSAAFTRLAPLLQNLLQVFHFKLLQVHCGQVQLLVCKKKEHLRETGCGAGVETCSGCLTSAHVSPSLQDLTRH